MSYNNCADCSPERRCPRHRQVRDGEVVYASMALMDSMQRDIAVGAPNASMHEHQYAGAIRDCETKQAQIQAYADHFSAQFAAERAFKANDPAYQACTNDRAW